MTYPRGFLNPGIRAVLVKNHCKRRNVPGFDFPVAYAFPEFSGVKIVAERNFREGKLERTVNGLWIQEF